LVETGTRGLLGAVFGPTAEGETSYAGRLLHLLTPEMLVLWDRGFDGEDFLAEVHRTGAKIVGRVRSNRRTPVAALLDDGSYYSNIGTVIVRIIEASITVTCDDGVTFTGVYRLVTTLLDHRKYPAARVVALYHERWEHESAYYALKHTIMNGRVLRSGDPLGIEQEMWSLLTLYQVLRTAMVDAVESVPGIDPDRAGFTIALHKARDQVILAAGVLPDDPDPVGVIGRAVLADLLPPRRPRVSTRKVKSPTSRYAHREDDGRPLTSMNVTALDFLIHEPATPTTTNTPLPEPAPGSLRERVLALLRTDPHRTWRGREIADRLGLNTYNYIRTELNLWSKRGAIHKISPGEYKPITPEPTQDLTEPPPP